MDEAGGMGEVVESSGLVDSTVIAEESATIATSFG